MKTPPPRQYTISIPPDLPPLDGTLSRVQRVEIALDVIATLNSRQRKLKLASFYFSTALADIPSSGQLHSSRIHGECEVCARGMLFIKSVDRFDDFDLENYDNSKEYGFLGDVAVVRTRREWGCGQAQLIETRFLKEV